MVWANRFLATSKPKLPCPRPPFGKIWTEFRKIGRVSAANVGKVSLSEMKTEFNEEKFIALYVALTGASESLARCVYMFIKTEEQNERK